MHLDHILTIRETAALAGWSRRRMLRHLLRLNGVHDGEVLVNVGTVDRPRWTVTMGALQRIAPQWFVDSGEMEARVAGLEEKVAHYSRVLEIHTERLRGLRDVTGTAA